MDSRKAFNELKKNTVIPIDFGYIFVDENNITNDEVYDEQLQWFNHFETYSNWYLPFDRCTHFLPATKLDSASSSVTFIDNPEHKLSSTINFITTYDSLGVIEGSLELKLTSEFNNEAAIAYQKSNPDSFIVRGKLRTHDSCDQPKFVAVMIFKKFHLYDPINKVKRSLNLNINHSYEETLQPIINQFVSITMYGFTYFTRMIINTELFVVEERVARMKKGVMQINNDKIPLFRIIDIKTLRSQYIKRETDCNGNKLEIGYERRRHTRTFRSDYYKNRKGETITIEPTWIGPIESYDPERKRLYKVLLHVG